MMKMNKISLILALMMPMIYFNKILIKMRQFSNLIIIWKILKVKALKLIVILDQKLIWMIQRKNKQLSFLIKLKKPRKYIKVNRI